LACFYYALINLDSSVRQLLPYIGIVTIARTVELKEFGPVSVLSGLRPATEPWFEGWVRVDPSSEMGLAGWGWEAPASFGAQMRMLDKGLMAELPAKSGGFEKRLIRGWCLLLCADYPAAGSLLPYMV